VCAGAYARRKKRNEAVRIQYANATRMKPAAARHTSIQDVKAQAMRRGASTC